MLLPPQRGPHGNSIVIIATVGMEASEAGYNRHPWQWLDFHLHHKRSWWCHLPQSCHHAHQHLVPCLQGLPHWTSPPEISCPYSHDLTADDRYGLNFGGTGGIGDVSRDGELSDSVVGLESGDAPRGVKTALSRARPSTDAPQQYGHGQKPWKSRNAVPVNYDFEQYWRRFWVH